MKYSLRLLFVSLFLISCGNDAKEDKASNSNNNQGDVDISGIWLLKNEPSFLVLNIDGTYAFAEFWDDRDGESGGYSWQIDSREECDDDSGNWHVKGNELCRARCQEPEDVYCAKFELNDNQLKIYYDSGPGGAGAQVFEKVEPIKFHKESPEELGGDADEFLGVWLKQDEPHFMVFNNDGNFVYVDFWDDRDGDSGEYRWGSSDEPAKWAHVGEETLELFQYRSPEPDYFRVQLHEGDYITFYFEDESAVFGRIKSIKIKE